jgi:ubiquinone/menaquinone biosynthesis C-methylase UbiE
MSWIDEFYVSGFYAKSYEYMFSENETRREVEGILRLLDLKPGSHILDWCGGWGRHSVILAQMGYKVTLLDYTPMHLEMAEKLAWQAGVNLNLIHADFRDTPEGLSIDAAINMFTAGIGYFEKKDDILALSSLYRTMNPGGKLLIDTMSLYLLARNYNPRNWRQSLDGSIKMLEERTFNHSAGRNEVSQLFIKDGVETRSRHSVRAYTPHELAEVLSTSGFQLSALYGTVHGEEFSFGSKRLVAVANRS